MEQEQPLSTAGMLGWSAIVVAGVLLLAAFGQAVPEKAVIPHDAAEYRQNALITPIEVSACDSGPQINVHISFNAPRASLPGLACSEPLQNQHSPLAQLTTTSKPLVISFEP